MTGKEKVIRNLRCATCDKEELNRQILRLRKCFREVERALKHEKKS